MSRRTLLFVMLCLGGSLCFACGSGLWEPGPLAGDGRDGGFPTQVLGAEGGVVERPDGSCAGIRLRVPPRATGAGIVVGLQPGDSDLGDWDGHTFAQHPCAVYAGRTNASGGFDSLASFNTPVAYEVDVVDEGTVFGISDETASWTVLPPHSPFDPGFAVEFDLFRPGGVAPFTVNDGGMSDGG